MALKQVTDASFVDDVLNQKGVVVVDFWAPWCRSLPHARTGS